MFKYMYVHTLYVYVCVCMYIQNERVCHTISGLKCAIRRTPTDLFWKPKKYMGWYISCGQAEYFSKISCLTPPQIFQG